MPEIKYEVIKDIPGGWEVGAKTGDVLTVETWRGGGCSAPTLMKDGKAVCDVGSKYEKICCKLIE